MPFLDKIETEYYAERCVREAWDIFKGIHYHNCYEIYFMEEGEIVYFIQDKSYRARRGDFILIPPGVPHKTLPYHSHAHTRKLLYLSKDFIDGFKKNDSTIADCFATAMVTMGSRPVAERILNEIISELSGAANPLMISSLVGQLLVYLNRWASRESSAPDNNGKKNTAQRRADEIVKYIDAHYREDITLSSTAENFYMSATYLSRIFRRETGRGFSEYLVSRRLKEAVYLLNNTHKRISEIAHATGFNSDNHFCKTFRKHLGSSPGKYRRN